MKLRENAEKSFIWEEKKPGPYNTVREDWMKSSFAEKDLAL